MKLFELIHKCSAVIVGWNKQLEQLEGKSGDRDGEHRKRCGELNDRMRRCCGPHRIISKTGVEGIMNISLPMSEFDTSSPGFYLTGATLNQLYSLIEDGDDWGFVNSDIKHLFSESE